MSDGGKNGRLVLHSRVSGKLAEIERLRGALAFLHANGEVYEGPYVDGKKHGQWTERFADGQVEEGPYVDDKRHGLWTIRPADGSCFKLEYSAGVRVKEESC